MSTYTQIHLQLVFGVKYRRALIGAAWKEELHGYQIKLIENRRHKLLAINSMPDHQHLLIGYRPSDPLPDLLRTLKSDSSAWVNQRGFLEHRFAWQEGYAAFSYERSAIPVVAAYIQNQEEHHRKMGFHNEVQGMLQDAGVSWQPEYFWPPLQ
ncbi:IS200/IS605 family transposase [Flaviaesturariibacter aridisoli]|uniref:IS200/IS605 family transposase n=1 Tax=Flaviaesturariibacter aridisoli TaxID=2545761 RepID=A0A4R4E6H5_9BACT|nr:IS200/IS605 family transposase [Flaviaesturariibacter aridisoli]TCZ73631.1 IS200/IS605 family transposase [Flaviaesturariibacter aridisoli]